VQCKLVLTDSVAHSSKKAAVDLFHKREGAILTTNPFCHKLLRGWRLEEGAGSFNHSATPPELEHSGIGVRLPNS